MAEERQLLEIRQDASYRLTGSSVEVRIPGEGVIKFHHLSSSELAFFQDALRGVSWPSEHDRNLGFCQKLVEASILKPMQSEAQKAEFASRTIDWMWYQVGQPVDVMQRISRTKVCLLGCGGLGSVILLQLLQTGFKQFLVLDSGKVNAPDFNRQVIYSIRDIGSMKADICKQFGEREFPGVSIAAVARHCDTSEEFLNVFESFLPDLVFSTVDTPPLVDKRVVHASLNLDLAVMLGGTGIHDAVIGPLLVGDDDKLAYLQAKSIFGALPVLGSNAMTNAITASYMAYEALRHVMELPSDVRGSRRTISFR